MKKQLYTTLLLLTLTTYGWSQSAIRKGLAAIDTTIAFAQLEFLASDQMQGRLTGTPYAEISAQYIASELKKLGYNPTFQNFIARGTPMQNVLVTIPGKNTSQTVVVGAHFDHLGVAPNGDVYNGADDNASGVVAVLQIARAIKEANATPKYNIMLAFWDGEENGLNGSRYFVSTLVEPSSIRAYVNFDLIGRNADENNPQMFRYFYSLDKPQYRDYLDNAIKRYKLQLKPDFRAVDRSLGGSDNSSFSRKGIPIVWYHTDGHADFHKPSDTADKINRDKMMDIIQSAYIVSWSMAQ